MRKPKSSSSSLSICNFEAEVNESVPGLVVMNTSGYTERGLLKKLDVQVLFGKIIYLSELPEFCRRDGSLIVKEIFGVAE
ncbi:hypothetical protein Tco_1533492 [Tanacetum coccineum]